MSRHTRAFWLCWLAWTLALWGAAMLTVAYAYLTFGPLPALAVLFVLAFVLMRGIWRDTLGDC